MANNDWVHRTTKQPFRLTSPAQMKANFPALTFVDGSGNATSNAEWIYNPDLTAVAGFPTIYWIITGDLVTLMDQTARDAVDAANLSTQRDTIADRMDDIEDITRALALVILDELNLHAERITAILDAIDNANNLGDVKTAVGLIPDVPQRTIGQMKTGVRNNLGS